jgi:HK97 family phage prohead protease|nr:MAG TPA: prohead serine protease [Caudoviricetes sp.]
MKIQIREDSVEIEGYVNAVERNSKPLMSRIGKFVEKIRKGAFNRAIKRNDVHILLNHDWNKDLGSISKGNLTLEEDSIGLKARATITDTEVVEKARRGDLVGWSFGFEDTPDGVESGTDAETGFPLRNVKDLILHEVSILDKSKTPAYDGTLITARSEDDIQFRGEAFITDVEIRELPQPQEKPKEEKAEIDYSKAEKIIKEMKEEI